MAGKKFQFFYKISLQVLLKDLVNLSALVQAEQKLVNSFKFT